MKKNLPTPFDPTHARYSKIPFPSHQFIPTLSTHPSKLPPPPQSNRSPNEDYLYGVDLYNFNYWWEAHESWEKIWMNSSDDFERKFLQGLIQISAAMIKWWLQQEKAMEGLLREGMEKLRSVPQKYQGVDLSNFLARVSRFAASPSSENYPFLDLEPVGKERLKGDLEEIPAVDATIK